MLESLNIWMWTIIAIDLILAVAAIAALRFGSGILFGVDSRNELAEKDNLAFGLALAGGTAAVALVLAGAGAGDASITWVEEVGTVAVYALVGLILLKVGILLNDAIVFHRFSIKASINAQNTAAGVVQGANLLALGLLINAAIDWVEGDIGQALVSVVIVFFLAQIVVVGVTRLRSTIYARRHDGARLQEALEGGNTGLAVRYAGHLLGTALAASSAGGMVPYVIGIAPFNYGLWIVWAVVLAVLLSVLSIIAQRVILMGIDVVEEVDTQKNVGVAAIEAAIFIGFGIVIHAVIG